MKIERTTSVDLDDKEIEIFMTALARLNGIGNWAEEHENELPEPAKPMADEAYKAYNALESFLQWMCVNVDDLLWDYEDKDYKEYKGEC